MKTAARAIILHENRILLVKHRGRDFFSLPGGKINPEEGIRSALRRELLEELGIDAQIGNLLFVHEFRYPKGSLSIEFFFLIENGKDFTGELGGLLAEEELAEIRWIDLAQKVPLKPDFLTDKLPVLADIHHIEYHSDLI